MRRYLDSSLSIIHSTTLMISALGLAFSYSLISNFNLFYREKGILWVREIYYIFIRFIYLPFFSALVTDLVSLMGVGVEFSGGLSVVFIDMFEGEGVYYL